MYPHRSEIEWIERLNNYRVDYIYKEGVGCIAWVMGTGDNIEILFLESHRPGGGTEIYRRAVAYIESSTPTYHSYYAITRTDNDSAIRFYTKLGWKRDDLGKSIYGGAETTLFSISVEDLKRNLGLS